MSGVELALSAFGLMLGAIFLRVPIGHGGDEPDEDADL